MKILNIFLLVSVAIGSGIHLPQKKKTEETLSIRPDPYVMIRECESLLMDGDLIVRLNIDPASQFIKNFNRRDKKYSHAGLLFFENGQPFVYHIINGSDTSKEFIVKESFANFCNPKENLAFGVFRYELNLNEIKKLKILIRKWQINKIRFDHQFSLETDRKMYCSEMVSKAISRVTQNRIKFSSTMLSGTEAILLSKHLHTPYKNLMKLGLIAIDNLYNPCFTTLIIESDYELKSNQEGI